MSGLKEQVARWLTSRPIGTAFQWAVRHRAVVFMLHRFADPELGVGGHDPAILRAFFAQLRRERYRILALDELIDELRGQALPRGAIAFTVDDGYADFARVGAPIFIEFDVPVTVFVVTGFIDRRTWLWWDRVDWLLERHLGDPIEVELGGRTERIAPFPPRERMYRVTDLVEHLKEVPDRERRRVIEDIERALNTTPPSEPPARYGPMTWDQIRSLRPRGMSFGPHTDSHPVLSRLEAAESQREIAASVERLRVEIPSLPIFAYPNGDSGSFGPREVATLRSLGLAAAVSTSQRYVTTGDVNGDEPAPFAIPRMAFPKTAAAAMQIVCGLELIKQRIRGEA